MKKTIKLLNGNILKEGKKYRWSGQTSSLYTSMSWKNDPCRITKIKKDKVTVYDRDDNSEYTYTLEQLKEIQANFKKRFF